MNYPDTRKWIKMTLFRRGNAVIIGYEDGLGNKAIDEKDTDSSTFASSQVFRNAEFRMSKQVPGFILAVLNEPPLTHFTRDGEKIIPLPIFIDAPDFFDLYIFEIGYFEYSMERLLKELFPILRKVNNTQLVFHLPEISPKTFQLPFTIHYSGSNPEVLDQLVQDQYWYNNENMKAYGFKINSYPGHRIPEDSDILVLQDSTAETLLDSPLWNYKVRPLLLVIIDPYPHLNFRDIHKSLAKLKCPCLHLSFDSLTGSMTFLKEFVYCIIHDFPFHEALHYSREKLGKEFFFRTMLYASPLSNHNLRMHKALESFQKKFENYTKLASPGNTENFLRKFDLAPEKVKFDIKDAISKMGTDSPSFLEDMSTFTGNFNGESTGLAPLADREADFDNHKTRSTRSISSLDSLVNDKDAFSWLKEKQERKVDITLEAFGEFLLFRPIDPRLPLLPNTDYRLNVSIGQRSPNSLIKGDIPAIDPLLPDPNDAKGHEIEVVVFAKDFTLLSERLRTVYLPLLGGTNKISFSIRTPQKTDRAQLRVGIFHKNNLLQAFLLDAKISSVNTIPIEDAISVTLDLSTSAKFSNLDKMKSPDIFIGMNKNLDNTNALFIKKDSFVLEVPQLSAFVYDDAQKEFRELLSGAYFDEDNESRFRISEGKISFNGDFKSVVGKLGRFGYEYYRKMFNEGGELEEQLKKISASSLPVPKIQIGRHNSNYSFPWPMLYDFDAPPPVADESYPICYGKKFNDGEHDAYKKKPGFGCRHNPDTYTWCIDGFWGTRTSIQQLFKSSVPKDADDIVVNPERGIYYSCNVEDIFTTPLTTKMQSFQPAAVVINPDSNLMDDLWNDKLRPSSLVVLGHLERETKTGEPVGPRIITFPRKAWQGATPIPENKWIYSELIFRYRKQFNKWKNDPLSLVFLINCSSGDLNVRSLNSIVEEFYLAGASAVVATECDITSPLGVLFVEKVLRSLYEGHNELGEAIREFNWELFAAGIPLAFVFTCYGNTNLKIASQPT